MILSLPLFIDLRSPLSHSEYLLIFFEISESFIEYCPYNHIFNEFR